MDTIGQRIKVLREMRGISQSELSRRISVTPQAIQSLESDSNPNRKTKHVVGIAAVLDVDPRYLDLQTSYDQFRERFAKQSRHSQKPAAIDSLTNSNDDALIDLAIEQARNNVNLQLKLSGETISGREYLERLSGELRRLTE